MEKPELLAPAGTLEKLKFAVQYGADAVYIAGKKYGLRAFAGNFSREEMAEGIAFAHERGVKVYVTVNVFAHNADMDGLEDYLRELLELKADAIIASDPGVIRISRMAVPDLPVHISTQANSTNWSTVQFWKDLGAERVVLARELTLPEIQEIREKVNVELETFVHGAMCISYSGRCLLSNYMTDRDSNQGQCAQACRWNYNLVEEKRPNEFYPIQEDERGTYVFNSQDLCLLQHLPELIETGIKSLKIEGRMKSAYYVATIIRAYRNMIDAYYGEAEVSGDIQFWLDELQKVSHRPYTTGFYFGKPENGALTLESSQYIRPYDFIGVVKEYDAASGMATIEQRNHFKVGDTIEFFSPQYGWFAHTITEMYDKDGNEITVAPHAQMVVRMPLTRAVYPMDMMRKQVGEK
ncbi:MAG: U32 family peptidase [Peptococcaceae bacterium]|nr:U32 family peptidase [Peptococcaceae bacterium]